MSSRFHLFAPLLILSIALSPSLYSQPSEEEGEEEAPIEEYAEWQTEQLRLYVGSDMAMGLGFRTNSLSYSDATAIIDASVTPKIGIFPARRLMVGGCFDLFGSVASFDATDSYAVYSKTWGGFMRYYLKGGLFGELQYSKGSGYERLVEQGEAYTRDFRAERYSVGVGLANFWTKHFNFEVLLKYSSSRGAFNNTQGVYLSGLSITAGFGFSIAPIKK